MLRSQEEVLLMKIAQIAPLCERVPPKMYGGTERIVSYLTEELVRQGHDVTLFASADSVTSARLRPGCDEALRLAGKGAAESLAYHIRMIEMVAREAANFDVIHFHTDFVQFPVFRRNAAPTLTTLHGRLDIPEFLTLFREFEEVNLVSISNSQRRPMQWANWAGTVYHGLPVDLHKTKG